MSMHVLAKPFSALTAADLMTRDVVAIPERLSLRAAAHLLAQAQVTGAPVIDENGACVGVISGSDFVRWADDGSPRRRATVSTCVCADWQVVEVGSLPLDEVGLYMTTDVVTVAPHTGIVELARMMLDAHIHRVIVVDARRRPVGVLSTTDVLAAVANAEHGR
jgi:CBS-domain-containing membrane protein